MRCAIHDSTGIGARDVTSKAAAKGHLLRVAGIGRDDARSFLHPDPERPAFPCRSGSSRCDPNRECSRRPQGRYGKPQSHIACIATCGEDAARRSRTSGERQRPADRVEHGIHDVPRRGWPMPERGSVQKFGAPVLAVCGFSGSGKTTLLEAAIPHLIARGLAVAAIKHDSHGFVVDKEGKDSERLFRAGATVALRGPAEQFLRRGASSALTLEATLADLARDHDLLLVEGHKDTPLPKLWVGNAEMSFPPEHVTDVQEILPWDSDRLTALLKFIDKWLPKVWASRPLYAGLLVGGKSSRMGRPKQLLSFGGIRSVRSPRMRSAMGFARRIPTATLAALTRWLRRWLFSEQVRFLIHCETCSGCPMLQN